MIAPSKKRAWDYATGNGQAAVALSNHFEDVVATDASEKQISNAAPCEKVCYRVATEDDGGLDNGSVDLITVAQALHWFDVDAFAQEADRVLRPGGVLAAWTYNFLNISREIDSCINDFYRNVLGTFWPPERNMVENGYRDISLPFKQIESPRFEMI